jgi:hypothetical protein
MVKSRRMVRWAGNVARMRETQEGKRPLGRPRCRRVDIIKVNLGEVRWGAVDWIGLLRDWDK